MGIFDKKQESYDVLKANYDKLKEDYDKLVADHKLEKEQADFDVYCLQNCGRQQNLQANDLKVEGPMKYNGKDGYMFATREIYANREIYRDGPEVTEYYPPRGRFLYQSAEKKGYEMVRLSNQEIEAVIENCLAKSRENNAPEMGI